MRTFRPGRAFSAFLLAMPILSPAARGAASCESLRALALANTTITAVQEIGAGEFNTPGAAAVPGAAFKDLPAFCRVAATLKPTSESDIRVEVWMPASGWNGKIEANGNGGWSGSIRPAALAAGLRRGYATAMTDTGHQGSSASFALGHPEKLADFGYRAVHEMAVAAKAIVAAYYGRATEVLLLDWMLGGRAPGPDGGAAIPQGFRRHHRRSARPELDRPGHTVDRYRAGGA